MRARSRPIVALLSTVVVLSLVVFGAAVGGSWELEDRDIGTTERPEPPEATPDPPTPPTEIDVRENQPLDWGWLETLIRILMGVAALLALWWGWQFLRDRFADRTRSDVPPGASGVAAHVAAQDEPALPVLRRGVSDAQRYLDEIPVAADAVIAAWLALEDAAQASGVRRSTAQTPTEFTRDVLERTPADHDATRELLGLYHRARFSDLPVGEVEVARASACLARLAANWSGIRGTAGGGP